MENIEQEYLNLCSKVLKYGEKKADRTGTGTISMFGPQIEHDMSEGFPLLTTKRVPFRLILGERLWFISGSTNIKPLVDQDIHIWDEWPCKKHFEHVTGGDFSRLLEDDKKEVLERFAKEINENENFAQDWGELGPVYGKQLRDWDGVDQLQGAIDGINMNPDSRRNQYVLWNPTEIIEMALPPCHSNIVQFYTRENRYLDVKMYQRSADLFLGVPFNIASTAVELMLIAQQTGYTPGKMTITFGDAHIYLDHIEQMKEQVSREPRSLPLLQIARQKDIDSYTKDDFTILGYNPHPAIKGNVSV